MAKNKFNPADSVNPETIALHGGDYRSDPSTTSVAVPIYQTTSYQFHNTEPVSYTHQTLPPNYSV